MAAKQGGRGDGVAGAPAPIARHGRAKTAEASDPLELVGTLAAGGDPDLLARCLIEEYALMGYDGARILALFRQPEYMAVHAVYRLRGEDAVRHMIAEVLGACGVWRHRDASPVVGAPAGEGAAIPDQEPCPED